ncbi:MAG: TIGR03960 family B12-binding radical SAM protein [Planctomycetota bacterium]
MPSVWTQLEPLLFRVQAPSQYIGCELNSIVKDHRTVDVKLCLAFPDTYKIGMSYLGFQILYGTVNQRSDALCERAFAPWVDMEAEMRAKGVPLFSLESHTPLREFDVIGFSLQHEMAYTNVLNMLDLGGVPVRSRDRSDSDPIVIAGGPTATEPEPLAEFVDLFVMGEGEEVIHALLDVVKELRRERMPRRRILIEIVKRIEGLYAPALYDVRYNADGTVASIQPNEPGIPERVKKAIAPSLDGAYYPVRPVVPFGEVVFERIDLEVMRGCPHRCRFCQSVVLKNRLRIRSVENLVDLAEEVYRNSGYDDIGLTSLSTGDYPHLDELAIRLNARFKSKRVGISFPSLRIDENLKRIPAIMAGVRKAGFTLAPEAGSVRMRNVIRKNITNKNLFDAVRAAAEHGWRVVKLYFLIGVPGETMADYDETADLLDQVSRIGREIGGDLLQVNATLSPHVPKPHTPYQWEPAKQISWNDEIAQHIRNRVRRNQKIRIKLHDPQRNYIEACFSRGDRRTGEVVYNAWKRGCKFDAWDEQFYFGYWMEAFKEAGLDPDFYALRERRLEEVLPWDHVDVGVSKSSLYAERMKSYQDAGLVAAAAS